MDRTYRIGEVSRGFGVSVRTLHHYDERGLLTPSARSGGGVPALQRRRPGAAGGDPGAAGAWPAARPHRGAAGQARRRPGAGAARAAAGRPPPDGGPGGPRRRHRRRPATARRDGSVDLGAGHGHCCRSHRAARNWRKSWSSTTQQRTWQAFERLAEVAGPEEIAAVERAWAELVPEVRAARGSGLDPASAEAQALGERWRTLTDRTFRGETTLREAVGAAYQGGAFAADPSLPNEEDFAFVAAVEAARGL